MLGPSRLSCRGDIKDIISKDLGSLRGSEMKKGHRMAFYWISKRQNCPQNS